MGGLFLFSAASSIQRARALKQNTHLRPHLWFRFPVRGFAAGVLLECLLGKPVESERGDGAVEMRGGKAPSAVRAAPAGEVVTINPDQAFTHTSIFAFVEFGLGRGGGIQHASSVGKVNSCPPGGYFPRIRAIGQSD